MRAHFQCCHFVEVEVDDNDDGDVSSFVDVYNKTD